MKNLPISLPALRGNMGDWIYYSCLMSLRDIADRVHYAEDIHNSAALSDLIQRSLEGPRARHIAAYLKSTSDRFFNSLVFATYDGSPQWLELGNLRSTRHPKILSELTEQARDAVGFLRLMGNERIFALDGQHRLAGIKQALESEPDLGEEVVSVLLVGHKKSAAGMQRTRRLFTTLNKTAKAVRKNDIIALDEDDVMAIVARRLVENDSRFTSPKIAIVGSSNLPASNQEALTNITNLYDVLGLVFEFSKKAKRKDLRFNRPSDAVLDGYYEIATSYFSAITGAFPAVNALMKAKAPKRVTPRWRNSKGGHLLFRPIGLEIFTRTAIAYAKARGLPLEAAVHAMKSVPVDIARAPYKDVIWNGKLNPKGRNLARRLLGHVVGLESQPDELLSEYRTFTKDPNAKLPKQLT